MTLRLPGKLLIEDDDEIPSPDSMFYPPWIMLNFPPIATPLGDGENWYGAGSFSYIPKLPVEMSDEDMELAYLNLHRVLRHLSVFERKFLLKVFISNMLFKTSFPEDVCTSLLGHLPLREKREMCREFISGEKLQAYLEHRGRFLLVRRDLWMEVFGERGEELYDLYSTFLDSLLKMMENAVKEDERGDHSPDTESRVLRR